MPLVNPDTGEPNHHHVASAAAWSRLAVNIADIYEAPGFDFSGARALDKANGYRSTSCLAIPLIDT